MLYTPQENTASSTAAPAGCQAGRSVPRPLLFPTTAARAGALPTHVVWRWRLRPGEAKLLGQAAWPASRSVTWEAWQVPSGSCVHASDPAQRVGESVPVFLG